MDVFLAEKEVKHALRALLTLWKRRHQRSRNMRWHNSKNMATLVPLLRRPFSHVDEPDIFGETVLRQIIKRWNAKSLTTHQIRHANSTCQRVWRHCAGLLRPFGRVVVTLVTSVNAIHYLSGIGTYHSSFLKNHLRMAVENRWLRHVE